MVQNIFVALIFQITSGKDHSPLNVNING